MTDRFFLKFYTNSEYVFGSNNHISYETVELLVLNNYQIIKPHVETESESRY